MEEEKTITAQAEEKPAPDMLEAAFRQLTEKLPKDLIKFFGQTDAELVRHGNYAEAVIKMKTQAILESFVEEIERNLKVNILYAYTALKSRYYEVMAYSNPSDDDLYVITLQSCQYSVVKDMTVTFYESYEPMYEMISKRLLSVTRQESQKKIRVLERMDRSKLYSHFFK